MSENLKPDPSPSGAEKPQADSDPGREPQSEISCFLKAAPVFLQPWWLEAVAPGRHEYVLVRRGEEIACAMPLVRDEAAGHNLVMPKLTQVLGPWLRPSSAANTRKLASETSLLCELVESLPDFRSFRQNFHFQITNWLPFYWAGFRQTTRYTYVLPELTDLDRVWGNLAGNTRTDIRKAAKSIEVSQTDDLDLFLEINARTFQRQGKSLPYSREYVGRIDDCLERRNARVILVARDRAGRPHAVLYLIWNEHSAYYLMGGADPDLRSSGAQKLLLWEAIRFAAGVTASFDFEGSMIRGVEASFRSFGAEQRPYFSINRPSAPGRLTGLVNKLRKRLTR